MNIISMEMENFRQYYGKQKIEFASGENNITIIFGENGKGKTGLFRALMFALYNATHIQQDNEKESIHLVNLKLLDEKSGPSKASVKVVFEHNGLKYEILRSVSALKVNNKITQRSNSVKLNEIDKDGNYSATPVEDLGKVQKLMNQILDEDIKDFFLFDGEKIDTLAKTTVEVKKEVKQAIYKLLQIESIEEARSLLRKLQTDEQRNVVNSTEDINAKNKQDEIDEIENVIAGQEKILHKFIEDKNNCSDLISKYELQLSQNKEVSIIQDKLNSEIAMMKEKESVLSEIKAQIAVLIFKEMPFLMLNDVFANVTNYLQGTIADESVDIPIEVIESSLEAETCLCCGNNLKIHEENKNFMQLLKENYSRSKSNDEKKSILRMMKDSKQNEDEVMQSSTKLLKQFNEKEKEIRELDVRISEIKKEVGAKASEQLNLAQTSKSLALEKDRADDLSRKIAESNVRIETAKTNKFSAVQQLEKIIKANENNAFEQKVIDIIKSIALDVESIASEFSNDMRSKLTKTTTDIFNTLIDGKDNLLIKEISVNGKYELQILSYDGIDITQDISQGQRQIVALSFITALAQVAAGDSEKIAFPLFMDSPFNRLSGTNRDQLIENIPALTSQWILLLTDTELTVSEERVFKEGGKLGKWYRINQIGTFHSEIEEVSITENMTSRGV